MPPGVWVTASSRTTTIRSASGISLHSHSLFAIAHLLLCWLLHPTVHHARNARRPVARLAGAAAGHAGRSRGRASSLGIRGSFCYSYRGTSAARYGRSPCSHPRHQRVPDALRYHRHCSPQMYLPFADFDPLSTLISSSYISPGVTASMYCGTTSGLGWRMPAAWLPSYMVRSLRTNLPVGV